MLGSNTMPNNKNGASLKTQSATRHVNIRNALSDFTPSEIAEFKQALAKRASQLKHRSLGIDRIKKLF